MSILAQENDYWNNLNANNFEIPLILIGGTTRLYYLINDIHEDLARFIATGRTDKKGTEGTKTFTVFPEEREQLLISHWTKLGFIITHHSQNIDYMHKRVTVTYLKVKNPATGISISLLPWFMLPDRPFPVFIYIYAIWHYNRTGKKSLSQSAAAASKLFGVKVLHKSTVSRSIKALENIINTSQVNRPLAVDKPELPSNEELTKLIPEILSNTSSIESLEERYQGMVKHLPPPITSPGSVPHALSGIPHKYSKVIKDKEAPIGKPRDTRRRPPRPRDSKSKHVQRLPEFVSFAQLEQTRKDFIEICRCLVFDAAVSYHRFLV